MIITAPFEVHIVDAKTLEAHKSKYVFMGGYKPSLNDDEIEDWKYFRNTKQLRANNQASSEFCYAISESKKALRRWTNEETVQMRNYLRKVERNKSSVSVQTTKTALETMHRISDAPNTAIQNIKKMVKKISSSQEQLSLVF